MDECVSSVLRQSKRPKEIIIVHDECSEPMHHADATTIMLPKNLGVIRARHEAFRYSTGEFILFLDGDDLISPDYLEKMMWIVGGGENDIAYPDIYSFGVGENHLSISLDEVTPAYVKENGKLPLPVTCLMARKVYEKLRGFRDFPVMEDLDFWLRAIAAGFRFKKAQTLLWYRQEGTRRNAIDLAKQKRIVAEIVGQFKITDKTIKKRE